jgi:hypothetical protein
VTGGKTTVIDGPFTESKELIASYAILEVPSMDVAVYWTRRFLEVLGGGECEIRPIYEPTDFPADVCTPEMAAQEQALKEEMQRRAKKG